MYSNNLFLNKYEVVPAKFPLELLKVEIDERNAKKNKQKKDVLKELKSLKKEMQEIHL